MQRTKGAFLQTLALPSHFWLPLRPSYFYLFVSSAFSLASYFPQVEEKKKNHRKKMNAKKGESLPFFFCFCIWDKSLLLFSPFHIPSTLSFPPSSSLVSHISSKLCATRAWELSQALEMEWAGNEVREVGGRR